MKKTPQPRFIHSVLLTGAFLFTAGVMTAQADTIVTFSVDMGVQITAGTFVPGTDTVSVNGSFNSWGALNLVLDGDPASDGTTYTNWVDDTTDANGATLYYKFVNSHSGIGYENLCDGGGNRAYYLPSISGSQISLPTPFFGDGGTPVTYTSTLTFQVDMSQQIALGYFHPGVDNVSVIGNYNGWNSGALVPLVLDGAIVVTNLPSMILTTNVYTNTFTSVAVSTNAHMAYQFIINTGGYEGVPGGDPNNDGGGNRFFTMLPSNQTFPIVFFHDAPFAPIVGNITFSVDMTIVALTDTNFNPLSVTFDGDLNQWPAGAVGNMTNDPTAANTNIYTTTVSFSGGVGSTYQYQYRYSLLSDPSSIVYDHLNGANGGTGNRVYTIANVPSTNVLSVFNDASLADYLIQPIAVFFSVDMNGAVGTDAHVFSPGSDNVYINGQFANWYAWESGSAPVAAPPGYQMIEQGLTTIYTNTLILPAGTPVAFDYKYGMDPGASYGGPLDDEAGFAQNHYRVVRSIVTGAYTMPTDTFGYQYNEPFFNSGNPGGGDLAIGKVSGGTVPVTWLGRPGARLQVASALVGGSWQDLFATDGTNWTSGYSSTNGFVSQTNYPISGRTFFRLVKP